MSLLRTLLGRPPRWPSLLAADAAPSTPRQREPETPLSVTPIDEVPIYGWSGWQMPDVQAALDQVRAGSLMAAHQLLLSMTEDPVFAHGLDTRTTALVQTPCRLVRPAGLPAPYFDALQASWCEVFSPGDLASSAHLRVALGVAPATATWELDDPLGVWMPRKIAVKDSGNLIWMPPLRRFRFSSLSHGQVTIEDDADPWLLFTELASQYPHLHGKLRSLAVVWWIKQAALRYLNNFGRVHGSPIRKVKGPAAQRESADFKALIEQAKKLFGGGVFTAPQYDGPSFDLELVEAVSQSHSVFETAIRLADEYFTLRLLGAVDNTRATGSQGSRARAEVHERVTNRYLGADCTVTSTALAKVMRRWCRLNGWPLSWAPPLVFDHNPPEDQQDLADVRAKNAGALAQLGQVLPTLAPQLAAAGASIDYRRLLQEHGVPLRDLDEAELALRAEVAARAELAQAAANRGEVPDDPPVTMLIARGGRIRKPGGSGGGDGGGAAAPEPAQRDDVGHYFGKDLSKADLAQAFDGGKHFSTQEERVSVSGDRMRASYNLVKDGERLGSIQRNFTRNGDGSYSVYHAYFELQEKAQGGGGAKEVFRNSVAFYQKHGVKEITVTAGLDKGRYVWASYGFRASAADVTTYRTAFVDHLNRNGHGDAAARAGAIREMHQIADFKVKGQRVGKDFLLNHTQHLPMWSGRMEVSAKDPGFRRLQRKLRER